MVENPNSRQIPNTKFQTFGSRDSEHFFWVLGNLIIFWMLDVGFWRFAFHVSAIITFYVLRFTFHALPR